MTKDEIIEMAKQAWISDKEAELITEFDEAYLSCTYLTDLTAFAKLVAQHEREACAKLCEELSQEMPPVGEFASKACAKFIRGQA
jgi:hypothetical protein